MEIKKSEARNYRKDQANANGGTLKNIFHYGCLDNIELTEQPLTEGDCVEVRIENSEMTHRGLRD